MKKPHIIKVLWFVSVLSVSCAREFTSGEISTDKALINISLTAFGDSEAEDYIARARLIIFRSTGQNGSGKLLVNTYKDQPDFSFEELVQIGDIDIYVIANELAAWNLNNVTTASELKDKTMEFYDYPVIDAGNPVPMFSSSKGVRINTSGQLEGTGDNRIEMELDRLYAKVVLNVATDVRPLIDVHIGNMPQKSWLVPQRYDDDAFFNGTTVDFSPCDEEQEGVIFNRTYTFYVPEYLISDKTKRCGVSVSTGIDEYTLVIGDGIDHRDSENNPDGYEYMQSEEATLPDLTVTRNTRYTFYITGIKNGHLEMFVKTDPWKEADIYTEFGSRTLNVSAITKFLIAGTSERIYFNSNQATVTIDPVAKNGAGNEININTLLQNPATTNFHYDYNPATGTGTGYMDLTPLNGTIGGIYKMYLSAGELRREITLTILKTSGISTTPLSKAYVGTFHRGNETGERVIRMANPNNSAWVAVVVEGDFITLDTKTLGRSNTNDNTSLAGNAESYKITGGARRVSGSGDRIYFRVGLTDNLPGGSAAPPRYGLIHIYYGSNLDYIHPVYVRQGEAADYLMRPTDAVNSGGMNLSTRPAAVRFIPYNMTDPARGTGGSAIANHNSVPLQSAEATFNANKFTDYPSQGGYFFQWNRAVAYHPMNPGKSTSITGWLQTNETSWSTAREICPKGYRHINDGAAGTSGSPVGSELRQSLFLNPQSGTGNNLDNSVWGYLADGFFDRGTITTSINGPGDNFDGSTVGSGSEIAYIGRLFYNPYNNASVFLPATGNRYSASGRLFDSGYSGYYWTSTSSSSGNSWYMSVFYNNANQYQDTRFYGLPVRCVQQ